MERVGKCDTYCSRNKIIVSKGGHRISVEESCEFQIPEFELCEEFLLMPFLIGSNTMTHYNLESRTIISNLAP